MLGKTDFGALSIQELEAFLADLYKQRFRLKLQKQMKVLEKTHLIKQSRRAIARAKTVLTLKRQQPLA